ncbi:hypothetical protein KXR53_30155 [Inquilinus limosus]|uniref:hypothetical protein n=1 Tax=Inquilinus limosus TaxID=171674 RepID=UPI003F18FAD4
MPLAGCGMVADVSGIATGGTVGAITANPVVGYSVGMGTRAAVAAGVKSVMRGLHRDEQDVIAGVAGRMRPGETQLWRVEHDLPFGYADENGAVQVTRLIETPLVTCKEILVTVEEGEGTKATRGITVGTICRQGETWKWSSAEPAVERWGFLQ